MDPADNGGEFIPSPCDRLGCPSQLKGCSRDNQLPPTQLLHSPMASRCRTKTRAALSLSNHIGRPWPNPDMFSTSKDCTCGMVEVPNLIWTDVCLCICGIDTLGRIFHLFFPARKVSDHPLLVILTATLFFSSNLFYLLLHCNVIAITLWCCASVCFEICLKSGLWDKWYFISVFFGHVQLKIQSFSHNKFILPSSSLIFSIACSENVQWKLRRAERGCNSSEGEIQLLVLSSENKQPIFCWSWWANHSASSSSSSEND